jgi:Tol biopolymer transport system component
VGADGTDPHPILVRNSESDPKWSPTDDRILFVDDGDIYVMRSDGTNVTNITNTASGESNAIWSPDGARIAFSEVIDSYWEIGVINVDGSGRIAVTRGHGADHAHLFPKWSPDGSALVGFPWPYLETLTAVPNGSYLVIAPGGSQPVWR